MQDKIDAELDAAGLLASPSRACPRQLVLEDLKALPYLAAATKEAMRMYPVVSVGNGRWAAGAPLLQLQLLSIITSLPLGISLGLGMLM